MYSWTPKISEITKTTGQGPGPAGAERNAGILNPFTSMVTSPEIKPWAEVLIAVCAIKGKAAAA
jgi:hypothetical protein